MKREIEIDNFINPASEEVNLIDIYEIDKINDNISYCEFFSKYLYLNIPCIIRNISDTWPANQQWIKNNKPVYKYLSEKYGEYEICASDCNERYYNLQKTCTMTFKEYLEYFAKYTTIRNNELPLLYMKDCHLRKLSNDNFYTVPMYFSSDWLNEYCTEKTDDDFQFVYMGPRGTWTPFHVDVYTSFSWSTNICGRKKWILFPPGEEDHLRDSLGNLPYDVTKTKHDRKCFEVIQEAGDAIFVPSGWHHQVFNEKDTISINHNWVNGCNIEKMWLSIEESLVKVKREIDDCKDMDDWLSHCQLMLKTYHGIDFEIFYDFLCHIAEKRIQLLSEGVELKQFDTWSLGKKHAKFDLLKIENTLNLFLENEDVHLLNMCENGSIDPSTLLNKIRNCLNT